MKTARILPGLILVFFMSFLTPEEVRAHKGHRGKPSIYTPYWVPNYAVSTNLRHVFFPDYNIYFDRFHGTYIYLAGSKWVVSNRIPRCYDWVNFAHAHKVGLNLDTPRPYVYNHLHIRDFSRKSDHYNARYYRKRSRTAYLRSDHQLSGQKPGRKTTGRRN